jgi:uncharacterized protein YbbC (DUF1343 family)
MKFLRRACYTSTLVLVQFISVSASTIISGSEKTDEYFALLKNKRVAIVANQTSLIGKTHLLDSLISAKIQVKKIFCPEHGFRGNADAGERVTNTVDAKTGLKIISLYGRNYKPKSSDLSDVDILLFDIQDVGVRFYTYLSTLHYVMEACAENGKQLIVLDRPNPNGFYVDGPVLDLKYKSFVGLHPVPLVYGMTIGEYALMINGEKWLKNRAHCDLTVIQCQNYTHQSKYKLPVRPSPNLPNELSVYLYPSLGLFEGTAISVGRGTEFPFQVFGHPDLANSPFTFTPQKNRASEDPLYKGQICHGEDLRNVKLDTDSSLFSLRWLIYAYQRFPDKENFFNPFFKNLAGSVILKDQIKQGLPEAEIRKSWAQELTRFKLIRVKYLLYPD